MVELAASYMRAADANRAAAAKRVQIFRSIE
jgi:hypothetical protein